MAKLITDNVIRLVYQKLAREPCEGCVEDWPSQFDHACMAYGKAVESHLYDFVDDYYEEAVSCVQVSRVIDIYNQMYVHFGADYTYEGVEEEIASIVTETLYSWETDSTDIIQWYYCADYGEVELMNRIM